MSDLEEDELRQLVIPAFYGTGRRLSEEPVDWDGFIRSVATPGGITQEGIRVLDQGLPGILEELLRTTLEKREKIKQATRQQYGLDEV